MNNVILVAKKILLGTELELVENKIIIIEEGKIVDILDSEELEKIDTSKYKVIYFENETLMPGMIDCHSHLNIDANIDDHLELLAWSNECELTLISLKALEDNLMSGVTTIRCLGDKFYIDVTLKDKINKNEILGPNILSSGIGIKGLHGAGYIGYPHCGVEEVRRTVRENLKRKVDSIKLFITGGQPPVGEEEIPSFLSYEEIKVAVDEAKRLNIPVAAHCIGGEGLKNCIDGGVKVLEHLYGVNDRDIQLLKNSDCWVDLTPGIYMDRERDLHLSKENIAKMDACREKVLSSMKRVVEANIPFTLGTDAYHGKLYREVEFAVELGADIKSAIKGITSNAAIVCNKENSIGRIEKGYQGDIIGVIGNPLEDIKSLTKVNFIMKNGKIHKNI